MDYEKELEVYIQMVINQYPLSCQEIEMLQLILSEFHTTGNEVLDEQLFEDTMDVVFTDFEMTFLWPEL